MPLFTFIDCIRQRAWFIGALLLTCLCLIPSTQAQNYSWAKNMGHLDINSSVVDESGNVYSTGKFSDAVDFDPNAGTAVLSPNNVDVFISKLDVSGNYVWAKRIGGQGNTSGSSIKVDRSGNTYITGYFSKTADFDPGPGEVSLSSITDYDVFVCKLDRSGNYVWARHIGVMGLNNSLSIAVDALENVIISGSFSGTADFDPGTGVANLTSAGYTDAFVSKLDASGNYLWAKRMGGTSHDGSYSTAVDGLGNVYTTGEFVDTVDFDPGPGEVNLYTEGYTNAFVSKLDASGNYVWAKRLGGPINTFSRSITVDRSGNVYTTGYFSGTADFDPGPGEVNLTSITDYTSDIFISKSDERGNYVWAKRIGGRGSDVSNSMAVDGSGNVYTTGYFSETADFDPGPSEATLTSEIRDAFVSKLDASGNYVWAKRLGPTNVGSRFMYATGVSIGVDSLGNAYTSGVFLGVVDFDPGPFTANLISPYPLYQYSNDYISKLTPDPSTFNVAVSDSVICPRNVVSLTASLPAATAYTWSASSGVTLSSPSTGSTISATLTTTGVKTVTVTVMDGSYERSGTVSLTATSFKSIQAGLWTNSATWSCNRVPLNNDSVTIGHLITLPAGNTQTVRRIEYTAGGALYFDVGATLKLSP